MLFLPLIMACSLGAAAQAQPQEVAHYATVGNIPVPAGFVRAEAPANSFTEYLRALPLKQDNNTVYLYDGNPKANQEAQFAVIKMDVGTKDLQQCADAVMRLRAEFLYNKGRKDEICFNFTSGHQVPFSKYAQGYRTKVKGNKVKWSKTAEPNDSYESFMDYMELIFMYAGSYSLDQELAPVKDFSEVKVGDVLIQGGFPGHAVLVVDVAYRPETGQRTFMLCQSYMPAQEIHILQNPVNAQLSPWYTVGNNPMLFTPEWNFYTGNLKRFNEK